jgi:hypothetical protein
MEYRNKKNVIEVKTRPKYTYEVQKNMNDIGRKDELSYS